jgi:hypothetical protein
MKMRMVLSTTFIGMQMSFNQICRYCMYLVDSMDRALCSRKFGLSVQARFDIALVLKRASTYNSGVYRGDLISEIIR